MTGRERLAWTVSFAALAVVALIGTLDSWEGERAGVTCAAIAFALVVYAARKLVTAPYDQR